MAGRLAGKVAVVTGGCSGIGLATVRRFAEEGAMVVIGDLNDALGAQVAQEVAGTYVHTDVASKEDVDRLFKTAVDTYGKLDIAFNNAGISPPDDDSILDTDLDAWRRVQEVNLTSVYLCCKAALPYMLAQKSGSIINTASFVADGGGNLADFLPASKGGVVDDPNWCAVCPRGHPGQCPVSGAGQHATARSFRQGRGTGRADSFTCPWADSGSRRRWPTRCSSSPLTSPRS